VLENLISTLLGRDSGPIERGKTIDQLIAPQIPADLPAALLERRPDILQAEQNLIAANANVGATRALYYPSFSITGLLGSVSRELDDFLTGNASAGLIAAGVTGPIFTFGGIEGLVISAEAQSRQAELFYRQTILNAFRETNNALTGSVNKNEQMQLQRERVEALREFARLARLRFDKGIASYLEVLVADNELFAAELQLVGLQAERYAQLINVYQSVGGGWVDIATAMAPAPMELQ
jgi:outer membrane protein, multidrug efflux system